MSPAKSRSPVLVAVFGLLFALPAFADEPAVATAARRVKQIVGHRGACAVAPENTLASYRAAIDAGATVAETDVRTSKDGVLVTSHDPDVARVTDGKGMIRDLTLEQLRRFDAGSRFDAKFKGERIATLREILTLCKDRIDVLLDIKETDDEYFARVAAEVQKYGQPKRTVVGVRSVEQAHRFRKLLPEARQLGLVPTIASIDDFAAAGVTMVRIWPKWLGDPAALEKVRRHKLGLHLNGTTGAEDEVRELLKYGPDSLSSDDPARLVRTLAKLHGAEASEEQALFESGKDGYHTYRIPALAVTPRGTVLAICEGRKTSRADHGDVDLVLKRSTDGGRSWTPMALLYEEGGAAKITIGNPCVVVDAASVVWLLFTRENERVFVTSSADEGQTWATPRDITASTKRPDWSWYATGPGNGIQLRRGSHKGRLVIPCDHRVKGIADKKAASRSHVIVSDDGGRSWQIGGVTDDYMNECAVAERDDNGLMLNMRSNRGKGVRGLAISADSGATWSEARDELQLVEPVCQASLIRFSWPEPDTKSRLVFANPADAKVRRNLTVRISYDEGHTWPVARTVHKGSSAYSALARLPDGRLGLLYEREDYRQIAFARIDLGWLESRVGGSLAGER